MLLKEVLGMEILIAPSNVSERVILNEQGRSGVKRGYDIGCGCDDFDIDIGCGCDDLNIGW